jgi:hypothetical protein
MIISHADKPDIRATLRTGISEPKAFVIWANIAELSFIKCASSQVLVGYTCNPIYSGGRNQEDGGSRPGWANNSRDTISKNTKHQKGLMEWLKWYSVCLASVRP